MKVGEWIWPYSEEDSCLPLDQFQWDYFKAVKRFICFPNLFAAPPQEEQYKEHSLSQKYLLDMPAGNISNVPVLR